MNPALCTRCGGPIAATPLTRGRTVCLRCAPLVLPAQPPAPAPRPLLGRRMTLRPEDRAENRRAWQRDYYRGIRRRQPRGPKQHGLVWRDRARGGRLIAHGSLDIWEGERDRAEIAALVAADRTARPLAPGAVRREYEVVEL